MSFRPYPMMTFLSIASLAVLILLGNWQWTKYSDKIGQPPEVAAQAPDVVTTGFTRLDTATPSPQRVYGIADGESIWRRYLLVKRRDTGTPVLLAVDATGGANPADTSISLMPVDLATPREVRVFERVGQPSPRNQPEADLWYSFDRAGMLSRLGVEDGPIPVAEPPELTVRNASDVRMTRITQNPYGAPRPIDPLPPERHFGYALTWWGLAAALVGVYLAFHMAQGRLRFRSAP